MTASLWVTWSDRESAVADLAREETLLARAAEGQPVLALSSWPGPIVVLGYAQDPSDVQLEWCRRQGIPVLRRITGGTAVIHQGDLGVALALPAEHQWAKVIGGLYDLFLGALETGLREAGSRVERKTEPKRPGRHRSAICFEDQSSDTLLVGGKKAVGCAQARRKGSVLIHAAVLLGLDAELYGKVFAVRPERVAAGLTPAITGISARRLGESIARSLASDLGLAIKRVEPLPPDPKILERWQQPRWSPVRQPGTPPNGGRGEFEGGGAPPHFDR